jgi:hypothetical protein
MSAEKPEPAGNRDPPSTDAVPLDDFDHIRKSDGELIIFDGDGEDGWVQSTCYMSRAELR